MSERRGILPYKICLLSLPVLYLQKDVFCQWQMNGGIIEVYFLFCSCFFALWAMSLVHFDASFHIITR